MGERFHVEPDELSGYSELLTRNAGHFLTIREHAVSKGGDTSGFTGLLALLRPAVTGVAELYGETLEFANSMMTKEAAALDEAAESYRAVDAHAQALLRQVQQALEAAAEAPAVGGGE
ncbi:MULTISPECIES: hypothetical protein [Actinosynnema]|uniref:ESX-1 secretion-associated protein n=1 Tax=Actinosynnema pretiosum TaxID=42197 RepID=A0A290ZFJ4_9PSEU|nr:hypothetical protein [Actinosynnema pretiosum]ATE57754.1 hypothetical protein CNX65_34295 [Actinosynnema pretiosum]